MPHRKKKLTITVPHVDMLFVSVQNVVVDMTVIPLTRTFQRLSIVVAKGQALKLRELQTLQALVELCPKGQALQVLVEQTLQALVETCSGADAPRPQKPYINVNILSKHEPPQIYYRFLFIRSYPSFCFGVHKKPKTLSHSTFSQSQTLQSARQLQLFQDARQAPATQS